MDYTTLTSDKTTEGSIKHMVNWGALPVESILVNAQSLIFSTLRVREMRTYTDDTFADGSASDTLPDRFLEAVSLHLTSDDASEIAILDMQHFQTRVGYQSGTTDLEEGTPTFCFIDSTAINLNVICDDDYTYRLYHYVRPALLSGSNTTNFLTDRYSHLLDAALRYFSFEHIQNDAAADRWLQKLGGYITQANIEHDYQKASIQYELYW